MPFYTTLILENEAITSIPPQTLAGNSTLTTAWVDSSLFNRMEFTFLHGSAGGSITGAIYQSPYANGSSPTLITGPNQNATTTGNTTGNILSTVECRSDQLTGGANPPNRYVSGYIINGNGTGTVVAGVMMVCEPRYGPQASNGADVDQRVFVN